jgi:hypothetical protein
MLLACHGEERTIFALEFNERVIPGVHSIPANETNDQ